MMSTNIVSFMKKIVKGSGGEDAIQRTTKPVLSPAVQENPSGRPSPGDLKHLTSEEKHILQRVWEKEEEFEQETQRLKVNTKAEVTEKYVKQPCRICRKILEPNEKSYMCDGCQQRVCDDCASYTSETNQEWKCSFCRRRHHNQVSRITNQDVSKEIPKETSQIKMTDKKHAELIEKSKDEELPLPNQKIKRELSKQDTRRSRPPVERQSKVDVPEETETTSKQNTRTSFSRSPAENIKPDQSKSHSYSHSDYSSTTGQQRPLTSSDSSRNDHTDQSSSKSKRGGSEQSFSRPVDRSLNQSIRTTKQKADNEKFVQPRIFSTSESSVEDPEDEDEKKRKIKIRKKSKFQKSRTEVDSPFNSMGSSTETGSAFESFDNDSRSLLTVQRRNSDSSDVSDLSGDGSHDHNHRHGYVDRRRNTRRKSLNYDSDGPAIRESHRHSNRLSSQKSYSFEDTPSEERRARRVYTEDFPIRNRAMSFDHGLAIDERRHRSLPRIPPVRPRYHDGDNIKIIIDDVDGESVVGRHFSWEDRLSESPYNSSYRPSHNRRGKGSSSSLLSSEDSSETEVSQVLSVRRKLPRTPDRYSRTNGEVSLKIQYDQIHMELIVTVMGARKLRCRRHSISTLPRAYCKLRILPPSGQASRKSCIAEPSINPEWNNVFVFTDISTEDLMEKILDVTIWDAGVSENHCFLGETQIPFRQVELHNTPKWYYLSSQTLLLPSYKAGSTGSLVPSTPAHDMARQLLRRGAQREMLQSRSLTDDYPYCRDEWKLVKSSSMDSTCK
ncbi:regulating synaptic membrane exocytosis protein 2-like isoform X2 [Centruroides sculpturatus]|uniref:regulating synaptic membrane exocytosis protein 2-like isoform X2 n=1 Tax=Centruroides sculpturatus TaxID=218467 RepID=UPI000C6CE9DA|nr:regulating synaptic membrane exocytosis protein 2-like isoform X2 [Centruroides sculpturatus]XP_023236882.1 regulating synaptic membrane exocytosis protein 2-like isoform X2 [Centruroides sculpturatus]